jgi:hypothetical protein
MFIIVYGQIQSWSPYFLLGPLKQTPANKLIEMLWVALLGLCPAFLAVMLLGTDIFYDRDITGMTVIMVVRTGATVLLESHHTLIITKITATCLCHHDSVRATPAKLQL